MRTLLSILLLAASLSGQGSPNCSSAASFVDARCACERDPAGKLCEMVKAGMYEARVSGKTIDPFRSGLIGYRTPPTPGGMARRPLTTAQPASKARVVALAHKDYLRFLHPNAQLAIGVDFQKAVSMSAVTGVLFGEEDGTISPKAVAALKEIDHLWMSVAGPRDIILLMTGRFEQGAAAGLFYSQGISPVFLGGAQVMMVGPEPSVQAALARLAVPAAPTAGWVARRARQMAKDHEVWTVGEPAEPKTELRPREPAPFSGVRQFAFGIRLNGELSLDGELVADSPARIEQIVAWMDNIKARQREKARDSALDAVTLEKLGASLRFSAKVDRMSESQALSSDLGVEIYSLFTSGMPGAPKVVAEERLRAVKQGMKREDVLGLVGRPLGVMSIQGLDVPRETWTYQVAFGKQVAVRMDGGIVTVAPAF